MNKRIIQTLLLVLTTVVSQASELNIPNTFSANTPAVAAQVNANFNAIETSVNDNDTRLDNLEIIIAQLQSSLNTANSTINQLQSDLNSANVSIGNLQNSLAIIENNSVLELDGFLKLSEIDGFDTAEFTSINIQLNNGSNSTDGTINGLGNFTIGYNEVDANAPEFCSDPEYTDSVNCIGNLNDWGNNVHTGSHNLILGIGNSYTQHSSIVAGYLNAVNNEYASSIGGEKNIVTGLYATITGGGRNVASGTSSSISGGYFNEASGQGSSISGGYSTRAIGSYSSISGGRSNQAIGLHSSVSGGDFNTTNGDLSHISGGARNVTNSGSLWSTVSGGKLRSTSGFDDWVAGSLFEDD